MKFTIAIYCSPLDSEKSETGFRFAQTIISQGHSIYRLFFFSEGVLNAANVSPLSLRWQELITANDIDAIVCVASADKHGVTQAALEADSDPLAREKVLMPGFQIGGLGQLIDASIHSDRIISFGN